MTHNAPTQPNAALLQGTTPATVKEPDELKRLEKTYDIAKEMFNFSENIIKTLDEKSRNSVATASAITAFAFVVRKPDSLNEQTATNYLIWTMAFLVGCVYLLHFLIVRPQKSKTIEPEELRKTEQKTTMPEEVVFYGFSALTGMYERNLRLTRDKGRYLNFQNAALGFTLLAALLYLAYGGVKPGSLTPATSPTSATQAIDSSGTGKDDILNQQVVPTQHSQSPKKP
ncbi:hypothetical protein [Deinococcus soli (ex Cha et al. 2016)]|uniref:hypothetical protein n=1 Tax=Deinococcus soli (ex Cha et al. 2016) TaxID=1309411 RepID=UPI0016682425|nr:hypothetical protein [Deinococcus soli (ex Cha et al. 2016)]GGB76529.1 hypothetical protein GCM10008019_35930 [Deinococcus soli (ex Cha et al. 2016)]